MSNASVIDKELEIIMNILYWFLLILIVMSIMKLNPWTLLVSLTSLLVSLSFALGSTVSKYVEVRVCQTSWIAMDRSCMITNTSPFCCAREGCNAHRETPIRSW